MSVIAGSIRLAMPVKLVAPDAHSITALQGQFKKICHWGGICKPSARLLLQLLNDPGCVGCSGDKRAIGNGTFFVELN